MRLTPTIGWFCGARDGVALDPRTLPLLRSIAKHGTLTAAAAECGVSYRAAWGVVEDLRRLIGAPLAALERGRGARLTPLGERLLAADSTAQSLLHERRSEIALDVRAATTPAPALHRLAIAASHDMALSELREAWRAEHAIDIEFHGSAASLARYAEGAVDIAGFHIAQRREGGREVLLSLLRDSGSRQRRRRSGSLSSQSRKRPISSPAGDAPSTRLPSRHSAGYSRATKRAQSSVASPAMRPTIREQWRSSRASPAAKSCCSRSVSSALNDSPKERILRIVVTRRRWMTGRDQRVDQRFVFFVPRRADRVDIVLPLRERPRTGDHRGHDSIGPQPRQCELGGCAARFFRIRLELFGDRERLAAEFGFHHPRILARAARVLRRASA